MMEPLLLEARCEISDIPLTSDTLIVEKYQKIGRKQTDDFFGFALLFMYIFCTMGIDFDLSGSVMWLDRYKGEYHEL